MLRSAFIAVTRRKIRLTEDNAKCRHLKKWPWKGLRQVFIYLRHRTPYPPPPLTQWYVYSIREDFFTQERGEGGDLNQREGERATVHKAGSKIPMWLTVSPVYKLCQHLTQVPLQVKFFLMTTFCFGVYIYSLLVNAGTQLFSLSSVIVISCEIPWTCPAPVHTLSVVNDVCRYLADLQQTLVFEPLTPNFPTSIHSSV